jgi:UV DNA damage repair endonuclease
MERVIQYVKDRAKLFDNYIPCIKEECDEKHAENLLKSIIITLNKTWINEKLKQKIHRENTTNNRGDEKCLSLQSRVLNTIDF